MMKLTENMEMSTKLQVQLQQRWNEWNKMRIKLQLQQWWNEHNMYKCKLNCNRNNDEINRKYGDNY